MVVVRHVPFIILLLSLSLLAACSGADDAALETPEGRLFAAMHAGDVDVTSITFDSDDAVALADLARAECPGLSAEFTRAVITAGNDSLVMYLDPETDKWLCAVYRPAAPREITYRTAAEAPEPSVALSVNGWDIPLARIQGDLDRTPGATEESIPDVVNAIISAELLRQEAAGLEPSDEDVAQARAAALTRFGVAEADLAGQLAQSGVTVEEFDAQMRDDARVLLLLRERLLLDEVTVTPEDAQAVYLSQTDRFIRSEQAVARLILIASEGRTIAQGEARAQELAARLADGEDFCALARVYSDDARSRDSCGTYVLPRGTIDPRLELAAFSTPANQTAVVPVEAGVYFVQSIEVLPASVVPYPEVSESLRATLRDQLAQERLNLYLGILRSRADIVSYLG